MKVRIKSGECPSYLTVGKIYKVYSSNWIFDDDGNYINILIDDCIHLDYGSWEVVDE